MRHDSAIVTSRSIRESFERLAVGTDGVAVEVTSEVLGMLCPLLIMLSTPRCASQ